MERKGTCLTAFFYSPKLTRVFPALTPTWLTDVEINPLQDLHVAPSISTDSLNRRIPSESPHRVNDAGWLLDQAT